VTDDFDFYSEEFQNNPGDTFERMIEHCPFHHSERWGWYSVFRHADVQSIVNANETYSAKWGPGPAYSPPEAEILLVSADPPEHTRQKRAVARAFNLKSMLDMEPGLRKYVNVLLDQAQARGRCDLIADIGIPVPLWVICRFLGLDYAEHGARFREWVEILAGNVFAQNKPEVAEQAAAAGAEMAAFFTPLVRSKMAAIAAGNDPGSDILSELAKVDIDGWRLSEQNLLSFANFLVIAGSGTTTNTIGNFFRLMLDFPDQYAVLRQQPELIGNAVEEVLRYDAPVHGLFRTNNMPVHLGEMDVPADSKICLMWGAANRDPTVFDHPQTFDITRDPEQLKQIMSFGGGIHRCMGAPLARLEVRVVAEEFVKRFPDFRELGTRVPYPFATLNGLDHLTVTW